MFKIYKIENQLNGKCYIGYTKIDIQKRFKQHIYAANARNSQYKIHQAIRKHHEDNFIITCIADNVSIDNVIEEETKYIQLHDSFDNGYNMNLGGTGIRYLSEAHKKALSDNNIWRGKSRGGVLHPMFGKKHSEESKAKMSETRKGRSQKGHACSEETKAKISAANKGRPSTLKGVNRGKEFAENVSKAKTGKVIQKTRKIYIITKPDGTQETIKGLQSYCKENNLSTSNMSSVAHGKLKQYKGYKVSLSSV